MAIKVSVISSPKNRISINKQDRTTVRTVGIAPSQLTGEQATAQIGVVANAAYNQANSAYSYANSVAANAITQLTELTDVDASDVDNNETIVYDTTSGKFVVKEIPIINGGTF